MLDPLKHAARARGRAIRALFTALHITDSGATHRLVWLRSSVGRRGSRMRAAGRRPAARRCPASYSFCSTTAGPSPSTSRRSARGAGITWTASAHCSVSTRSAAAFSRSAAAVNERTRGTGRGELCWVAPLGIQSATFSKRAWPVC